MDSKEIARLAYKLNLLRLDMVKLGQTCLGSNLVAKVFSLKAINFETFLSQMQKILQA